MKWSFESAALFLVYFKLWGNKSAGPNLCQMNVCQTYASRASGSVFLSQYIYSAFVSFQWLTFKREKLRTGYVQILSYADQYPCGFINVEGLQMLPCYWLWEWVTYLGLPESSGQYLGTGWENHQWPKCIFPNDTEAGMVQEFPPRFSCFIYCLPLFGGQAVQLWFAELGSGFAYWSRSHLAFYLLLNDQHVPGSISLVSLSKW